MEAVVEKLVERVRRLEDLEAIRATWLDYCIQLDSLDLSKLGDVFTTDAILEMDGLSEDLDGVYRGRDSVIADFYGKTEAEFTGGRVFATGHLSTNMQIELQGDEATTLAYFFEIVANNLVLIGTYQHRFRRERDRWRFAFLRIAIRYRARIEANDVAGQSLVQILARPIQ